MDGISLVPLFVVGLSGSVHCVGMCGGIVGALSAMPAGAGPRPAFPVPVRTAGAARLNVAAYNAGRILSYAAAGALAGGLTGSTRALAGLPALQLAGYWLANLMLLALGLYLMDVWRGLAWLEQGGRVLWRHLQPLTRALGPPDSPGKMFVAGTLWGWLPCGMVYSVLVTAMLSGSAAAGAAVMLAFGLGTLPMLLSLGLAGARLRAALQRRRVRVASGAIVLAFGLLGLARAGGGMPASWLQGVCVAPAASAS
ncbi:MAG: sulfite exporter TauE/SafE family protein [Massilia sp.]